MKPIEYLNKYEYIENDVIYLKLNEFNIGDEVVIPYYYYNIHRKSDNVIVGKISIRIGHNYHSYYNGNIGYEIFPVFRGNNYSYIASNLALKVAKEYKMKYLILSCEASNIPSNKTITKMGALLIEKVTPPSDYFGYHKEMKEYNIYKLIL
ncbi:GNAT family N-acetyltransferase [Acholeplasma sp. OttesenSCG-928-E16]|nr:GNAT family N-acetyltransferase [Acholeplasma sp. OttesenSCG-928-E16]